MSTGSDEVGETTEIVTSRDSLTANRRSWDVSLHNAYIYGPATESWRDMCDVIKRRS